MLDRLEIIGERQQADRFERPSIDRERIENGFQIRWRSQRKPLVICEEPGAFGRGLLCRHDTGRIGQRFQPQEPLMSGWRHREVGDGDDDAIELERPQCAGVHSVQRFSGSAVQWVQ